MVREIIEDKDKDREDKTYPMLRNSGQISISVSGLNVSYLHVRI